LSGDELRDLFDKGKEAASSHLLETHEWKLEHSPSVAKTDDAAGREPLVKGTIQLAAGREQAFRSALEEMKAARVARNITRIEGPVKETAVDDNISLAEIGSLADSVISGLRSESVGPTKDDDESIASDESNHLVDITPGANFSSSQPLFPFCKIFFMFVSHSILTLISSYFPH
jgi:hypothetical protein